MLLEFQPDWIKIVDFLLIHIYSECNKFTTYDIPIQILGFLKPFYM